MLFVVYSNYRSGGTPEAALLRTDVARPVDYIKKPPGFV